MTKFNAGKVYRIQRLSDNKFSNGGVCPDFSKNGKTWSSLSALHGHLTLVRQGFSGYEPMDDSNIRKYYSGCVIVIYDVVETQAAVKSII